MSKSPAAAHRVPPYKRPIIIIGFLVILALVVGITVLIFMNFAPKDGSTHLTPSDNNPSQQSPSQAPSTNPSTPSDEPEDKTPQYEGEDPNLSSELTGRINYNDLDPETQTIHAMVNIDQFLQADGQCVYNLKRDGAIVRTASAVAQPDINTSVCGPFNLSAAGLSGTYEVEIIITGDGKHGVISGEIQI